MDFFEHQERARRKTHVLVGYYLLAVCLIAVAVYLVIAMSFLGVERKMGEDVEISQLWNPDLFVWVVGGTLLVVVLGSGYKVSQLSAGGHRVAEMLGGKPIRPGTRDPDERKVLNVVEEMAIASGTPVPRVFLLDHEKGINAFAAGFSSEDAVIGVTRGCIEQLSRDELQGVIAHEFSHILNGDMRLNIRLVGVLHGILVIGLIGYFIFRTSLYSSGGRSREKGNKMPIVLLGVLIWIIGYVGVFFGKLIQSAVSRQREFLADASAVQFTRNPDGIAGALKKIGGWKAGSRLQAANAQEVNHFFFSNGLASSLFNMMASHPPLDERIRRIDPMFKGKAGSPAVGHGVAVAGLSGLAAGAPATAVAPGEVLASVGAPSSEHLSYAASILDAIPSHLVDAAREPFGARAVVYSLLFNSDAAPRKAQVARLREHADAAVLQETERVARDVEQLSADLRLPLADLAVSSLKDLSPKQYGVFRQNVEALAAADEQIDLFEFTLKRMILRHLDPVFSRSAKPSIRFHDVSQVQDACESLLACLAYWGAERGEDAQRAFATGLAKLGMSDKKAMPSVDSCGLQTVADALEKLAQSSPALTRQLVDACVACIALDGKITLEEAQLIRIVADSLRCPIPPILPGQVS